MPQITTAAIVVHVNLVPFWQFSQSTHDERPTRGDSEPRVSDVSDTRRIARRRARPNTWLLDRDPEP